MESAQLGLTETATVLLFNFFKFDKQLNRVFTPAKPTPDPIYFKSKTPSHFIFRGTRARLKLKSYLCLYVFPFHGNAVYNPRLIFPLAHRSDSSPVETSVCRFNDLKIIGFAFLRDRKLNYDELFASRPVDTRARITRWHALCRPGVKFIRDCLLLKNKIECRFQIVLFNRSPGNSAQLVTPAAHRRDRSFVKTRISRLADPNILGLPVPVKIEDNSYRFRSRRLFSAGTTNRRVLRGRTVNPLRQRIRRLIKRKRGAGRK